MIGRVAGSHFISMLLGGASRFAWDDFAAAGHQSEKLTRYDRPQPPESLQFSILTRGGSRPDEVITVSVRRAITGVIASVRQPQAGVFS
jgi:hypothetical protein